MSDRSELKESTQLIMDRSSGACRVEIPAQDATPHLRSIKAMAAASRHSP